MQRRWLGEIGGASQSNGKGTAKAQRQESPLQRANRASHNLTDGWEGRGESPENNVRALSLRETTGRAEPESGITWSSPETDQTPATGITWEHWQQ